MAFSKTPIVDTYNTERVSLFKELTLRDGGQSGKDENYINVFIEGVKKRSVEDSRQFLMKRAGSSVIVPETSTSNIRGMYYWPLTNSIYYAIDTYISVYNLSTLTTSSMTSVFSSANTEVGFCEFLYGDGGVKLVASDGTAQTGLALITTSNTFTKSTDVDIPAHLPNPIFLDGYLFLAQVGSAFIYNSVVDDPFAWEPDTKIQAEMEADLVVRIAKLNNYLVAFGKNTIEYYWNAANEAPDSPLQRNDTPIKSNTYIGGFAQHGNSIYFIGTDSGGQPDVFRLKDFKIDSIGTPTIARYLNTALPNITAWRGNIISYRGHSFYVLNANTDKTWAIDLETGFVSKLSYQNTTTFPIQISLNVLATIKAKTYFSSSSQPSALLAFDEEVFTDAGETYTCLFTLIPSDYNSLNRKMMSRLSLIGDRPDQDANVLVQWSDDDYQTFSTGRNINLNSELPCIYQLGSFRQRAFKFSYVDEQDLRLQDVEVNINKGLK